MFIRLSFSYSSSFKDFISSSFKVFYTNIIYINLLLSWITKILELSFRVSIIYNSNIKLLDILIKPLKSIIEIILAFTNYK